MKVYIIRIELALKIQEQQVAASINWNKLVPTLVNGVVGISCSIGLCWFADFDVVFVDFDSLDMCHNYLQYFPGQY